MRSLSLTSKKNVFTVFGDLTETVVKNIIKRPLLKSMFSLKSVLFLPTKNI